MKQLKASIALTIAIFSTSFAQAVDLTCEVAYTERPADHFVVKGLKPNLPKRSGKSVEVTLDTSICGECNPRTGPIYFTTNSALERSGFEVFQKNRNQNYSSIGVSNFYILFNADDYVADGSAFPVRVVLYELYTSTYDGFCTLN